MTTKTKAIRALNDELRQNFTTGTAVLTTGVAALGAEAVRLSTRSPHGETKGVRLPLKPAFDETGKVRP